MEDATKKTVIDWLRRQTFVDFIHDNDKKRTRARKWTRTKDLPDLSGNFVGGRSMYVEIKHPENKSRSFGQIDFLEDRRRAGCFAALVDSVDCLKVYLRAEGISKFND